MNRIERIAVESSMIGAAGYDEVEKILYLEFVNTGHVYAYYGVSKKTFTQLLKAPSVGRFVLNEGLDFYTDVRVRNGRDFKW